MKKQIETLTEQESAFAAENHSLIFRFLSRKGLPEDEYYDVVAFGYLNGVKKHFRREELRKQYSFTTLAWHAMNSCFANYQRSKARLKNRATVLCIHEPYHSALALEELISDARDYAEETLEAMRVREMLESFEQTEREIVRLLMQGYAKSEIRARLGLSAGQISELINQIQTKALNSPLMRAA